MPCSAEPAAATGDGAVRHFFVDPGGVGDGTLRLGPEETHHLRRVLRARPGERILVSDGHSTLYRARVVRFDPDRTLCRVEEEAPLPAEPGPRTLLLVALPRGDRMRWLVQKATEAGVDRIAPVVMERSVRAPAADQGARQRERWERIALEACKQCGRMVVPHVAAPRALDRVLADVPAGAVRLYCAAGDGAVPLARARGAAGDHALVALLVGPEGGASAGEEERIAARGWVRVGLGPWTLRVETAAVLAVALARYEWSRGRDR